MSFYCFHSIAILYQILLLTFTLIMSFNCVSFFGSSYISLPLQDSTNTTQISFRLKTSKDNTLLVFVTGSSDYCLVTLNHGNILVQIDLGSNENILRSVKNLKLNDLRWHSVKIEMVEREMSLTIDGIYSTFLNIVGPFFELNIDHGIYVGGFDDLTLNSKFLGNLNHFRGCIENLYFNNIDVFDLALTLNLDMDDISFECSNDFEGSLNDAISFIEEEAFMTLPRVPAFRKEGRIFFEIKTFLETALIFYTTGEVVTDLMTSEDFVAVEIINGRIKLTANEGNGAISVQSNVSVNDGLWHFVDIIFKPDYCEIKVDGKSRNVRPSFGPNQFYDLSSDFYIGGIELSKQISALEQGLESINAQGSIISFKGCLKNLKINSVLTGLPQILVSKGIKSKCLWEFPCLIKSPCIEGSKCYQEGLDDYRCFCNQNVCVKPNFTDIYKIYKSDSPLDLQLLILKPLSLFEGSNELITTEFINVSFDYHRLSIEETGIIFEVKRYPKYGILEIEVADKTSNDIPDNAFTYHDLIENKVRYTHSGVESTNDTIFFQLKFVPQTYRLAQNFENQKQDFIFFINIDPVNDPPRFENQNVLYAIRNAKKLITNQTLKAIDDDNIDSDLEYRLISFYNCHQCFLELRNKPDIPLTIFTQRSINKRLVYFVHRSHKSNYENIKIVFSLTDGIIQQPLEAIIDVKLENLKLTLVNNSGLKLPYNRSLLINSKNLHFSINADQEQELEIKFEIVIEPRYGVIQKLKSSGKWIDVKYFNQKQINKNKIRYLHMIDEPVTDKMSFRVSCLGTYFDKFISFEVNFIASHLKLVNNKLILIDQKLNQEVVIKEDDLKYEVFPSKTSPDKIIYTVSSLPIYGHLYLKLGNQSFQNKLKVGSTFTQKNIDDRLLVYIKNSNRHESVQDHFYFQVTLQDNWSLIKTDSLRFEHLSQNMNILAINQKLTVLEGDEVIITSHYLKVKFNLESDQTYFTITRHPSYGTLFLANQNKKDTLESFSSFHIEQELLRYIHDDSENENDSFDFIARPASNNSYYRATFSIQVKMKNDNPPQRVADRIFNVSFNQKRHLTQQIIEFIDLDLNTNPEKIQYFIKSVSNGAFYFDSNHELEIFQFTQKDINLNKIIFKHHGHRFGEAVFIISDGQFSLTQKLKIEASKPYIKVFKLDLIVKASESVLLTKNHLKIETNQDITNENDVMFSIIYLPLFGVITKRGIKTDHFTLSDLKANSVKFHSRKDIVEAFHEDGFTFRLTFKDAAIESKFSIKIYPESYWNNLILLHNKPGMVDQGKFLVITSDHLKVFHSSLNSWNITFTVKTLPEFGTFKKCDHPLNELDINIFDQTCKKVMSFTQFDINQRQISYFQNVNNTTIGDEKVTFQISTKLSKLPPIEFKINIITDLILLKTDNLTVLEGERCLILPKHLKIMNAYYRSLIHEYLILEEPKCGKIRLTHDPNKPIFSFTSNELESELVFYEQDGSESVQDWFTVVAKTIKHDNQTKESLPSTLHVHIEPVNDESPYLINNTEFILPQDSSMLVTSFHLSASDEDSASSEIIYEIIESTNGYFSNHNFSNIRLTAFTQDQIDKNEIDFVHQGNLKGFVKFQLSDGLNYDQLHYITVTANKVVIENKINQKLHTLPGMKQMISKQYLYSSTNNGKESPIIYHITKSPSYGKLLMILTNGSIFYVKSFSQNDINQGLMFYEQSENIQHIRVEDEMVLNIESPNLDSLIGIKFKIEISIIDLNDKLVTQLNSLIKIHSLIVVEGREAIINESHIKLSSMIDFWKWKNLSMIIDSVYLKIDQKPSHGIVLFQQSNKIDKNLEIISNEILTSNALIYKHDDSNTFNDTIEFGIYVHNQSQNVKITSKQLKVTIIPINDEKPVLITLNPFIELVKGSQTLINSTILNTVDKDLLPIVYHLVEKPMSGYFCFNGSKKALKQFTQSNIDNNWVYFQHYAQASSEQFKMKVTDGHFEPIVFDFTINIVPLKLIQVHLSDIVILQGNNNVIINDHTITFKSNNNQNDEDIFYRVVKGPFLGLILINNLPDNLFYQSDVNQNIVTYRQINMTSKGDYFILNGFKNNELLAENITINVTIKPLINAQNELYVLINQKMIISLNHLDASPLAKKTQSNPVYRVIQKSKFGYLKKSQDMNNLKVSGIVQEVDEFTHEDIVEKKIFYIFQSDFVLISSQNDLIQDSIELELSADFIQPALVSLKLNLFSVSIQSPSTISPFQTFSLSTFDYFKLLFHSHHLITIIFIIFVVVSIISLVILIKICLPKKTEKSNEANVSLSDQRNAFKVFNQEENTLLNPPVARPTNLLISDPFTRDVSITTFFRANSLNNITSPVTTFVSERSNRATISRFDNLSKRMNDNLFPLPPPSLYFETDVRENTCSLTTLNSNVHQASSYLSNFDSANEILSKNKVNINNKNELLFLPTHYQASSNQPINPNHEYI